MKSYKKKQIIWLVNEYFILSNKAYGANFKETVDSEVTFLKAKADEFISIRKLGVNDMFNKNTRDMMFELSLEDFKKQVQTDENRLGFCQMKILFDEIVSAGFTEEQAFKYIILIVQNEEGNNGTK